MRPRGSPERPPRSQRTHRGSTRMTGAAASRSRARSSPHDQDHDPGARSSRAAATSSGQQAPSGRSAPGSPRRPHRPSCVRPVPYDVAHARRSPVRSAAARPHPRPVPAQSTVGTALRDDAEVARCVALARSQSGTRSEAVAATASRTAGRSRQRPPAAGPEPAGRRWEATRARGSSRSRAPPPRTNNGGSGAIAPTAITAGTAACG